MIWFAYDIARDAPRADSNNSSAIIDAAGEPVNAAELATVANALEL